ncbi:DUF1801 domain-containing protein [Kribbella sp. NPDC026611]|uniref:iron chaperone n=1 Tax=Kribbella sp. NPDC026611 TaxID=3154911 RepID=UPI0033DC46BB
MTTTKSYDGFTGAERGAMKARAKELKGGGKEDPEVAQLQKIAAMADEDRAMATRLHELIKAEVPELTPKLWYGMPGWVKDGKVVCFFQDAAKFKARYATIGFNDSAALDEGDLWPVAYALKEWTPAVEQRLVALVRKAVS